MKRINTVWLLSVAFLLACSPLNLDRQVWAQGTESLVMVANKSNTAASTIGKAEARRMLLGQTPSWPNGSKVIVAMRPPGNGERAEVLKIICGMNESEYTRYGLQAMFTGQTPASIQLVASSAAVKNFVKVNPGAVGFLPKSEADDSVKTVLTLE